MSSVQEEGRHQGEGEKFLLFKTAAVNPQKTGTEEVIDIFWVVNDPPGLHGLNNEEED